MEPQDVACPYCKAPAGSRCRYRGTTRPKRRPCPSRRRMAREVAHVRRIMAEVRDLTDEEFHRRYPLLPGDRA